jgi:heat-inducible transcriptional repressor
MLTKRGEEILRIIIGEHISTAMPVGSETIARRYSLGISPATIRSEMAHLEDEGYIVQPHPSAGRIPLERGYRYYVETLMDSEFPEDEQHMIRHQFHQFSRELEQWLSLAASILSRIAHNMAIVTRPKAVEPQLKHLGLILLQEFLALLILVFREAKLRQKVLAFDDAISQEELNTIAQKLSAYLGGLTKAQIEAASLELLPNEERVVEAVVQLMEAEKSFDYEEPHIEGLHYILSQPEFAASNKAVEIMEAFEGKELLSALLALPPSLGGLQVVIGRENKEDIMHDCSVILGCYGLPGEIAGAIGVVGPTRMHYERAISAVRFLSTTMSELVTELYY